MRNLICKFYVFPSYFEPYFFIYSKRHSKTIYIDTYKAHHNFAVYRHWRCKQKKIIFSKSVCKISYNRCSVTFWYAAVKSEISYSWKKRKRRLQSGLRLIMLPLNFRSLKMGKNKLSVMICWSLKKLPIISGLN